MSGRSRVERLLGLIRIYRVDRVALHSLVYLLESVYGVELGYRGCSWELYATGPYCAEVERDLMLLVEKGRVRVDENGVLKPAEGDGGRVSVDAALVVREAWSELARRVGVRA